MVQMGIVYPTRKTFRDSCGASRPVSKNGARASRSSTRRRKRACILVTSSGSVDDCSAILQANCSFWIDRKQLTMDFCSSNEGTPISNSNRSPLYSSGYVDPLATASRYTLLVLSQNVKYRGFNLGPQVKLRNP